MSPDTAEELCTDIQRIEAALAGVAQMRIFEAGGQHALQKGIEMIRWALCDALSVHLDDPRLAHFDKLVALCDKNIIRDDVAARMRAVLLRIIAHERFDLPFQFDLRGGNFPAFCGAFLLAHSYTFRDDLPYQGDRSVLRDLLGLFPNISFPGRVVAATDGKSVVEPAP
ncbi:MAG: hypothetical protein PHO20_04650 [Candidatus Peribacteraceae bacterium]|nr:hypothetical protein [Candidatus Peribacteraceae bacterium]MDD5740029.1 hypothetical protein [Candidatus Peribacteraceae bacterium]